MPVMNVSNERRISPRQRRRSIVCAYGNGLFWGMASGLASTTLVTYLAREYQATGLAIGWLLAAPALVGLLRLFTPQLLERVGSRRTFCVRMFLASAAVLFVLPIVSAPTVLPSRGQSLVALGTAWAGYHLLEYMGVVALWSWFGDLVPRRIRGRFVGRRQAWANGGKVVGAVAAALGTYFWHKHCESTARPDIEWFSYAVCGLAGGALFAISVWPLSQMVDLPLRIDEGTVRDSLRQQLLSPVGDQKFRRLLGFGLWFSFSNGLIQSAQWMFQTSVLQMSFAEKKTLDSGSRGLQALLMPWVGSQVDRRGNVLILTVSQAVIAMAPLFFLIASPASRGWIVGAYVCWLAYAGENVTQPNLMLGLSPPGKTAAYASAWFAWTQLAYALSVLVGGALFDWLAEHFEPCRLGSLQVDHFVLLFLASWAFKLLGVVWAARIPEP